MRTRVRYALLGSCWSHVPYPRLGSQQQIDILRCSLKAFSTYSHTSLDLDVIEQGFASIRGLMKPSDWKRLADMTRRQCEDMVDDVILSTPGKEVVRKLDEISDNLCQVLDAAEFCRHVHGNEEWRQAAHSVCMELGGFVHELNTHYGLYSALSRSLHHSESPSSSEEWRLVGEMLERDFQRFGVHLEGEARDRMTFLIGHINELGHMYMRNAMDSQKTGFILVPKKSGRNLLRWTNEGSRSMLKVREDGSVIAPGDSRTCNGFLWHSDEEMARKMAYKTYNKYPVENVHVLEELLQSRKEMASIMGYPSYSAYQLHDFSLANTPRAVSEFLKALQEGILPVLEKERAHMVQVKKLWRSHGGCNSEVNPWDIHWAISRSMPTDISKRICVLDSLFTVSGFIYGLSALLEKFLGLHIVVKDVGQHEGWAPDIRKVCIYDHSNGEMLGTIYLDLFARPQKFGGAALFTLKCGKQLDDGTYQLPTVALVANISSNTFLAFSDLETLCHEFGHALHSLLSRTKYQHLSGTRGPQDVIEIPSHVFEKFSSDPESLRFMALNSGDPNRLSGVGNDVFKAPLERRRQFAASKLQRNVEMCILDQFMHGESFTCSSDWERGAREFLDAHSVPECIVEHPPTRFSHAVGYGGNYYSYLYANSVASAVWMKSTESNLSRNSRDGAWPDGKYLQTYMLRPGGAKKAKNYVSDILNISEASNTAKLIEVADKSSGKTITGYYPAFASHLQELQLL